MEENLLLLLILMPLAGAFFVLSAKNDKYYAGNNVYNVAAWCLSATLLVALYTLSFFDAGKTILQITESYRWLDFLQINVLLGADVFAMLLLLSINFSFLIANVCLHRKTERSKTLLAVELIFVSLINGYLLAADILSFYIFFAALSAPLIILISTYSSLRKKNALVRFSLYNLIGALLLFVSVLIIYNDKASNVSLNSVASINLNGKGVYFVWLSIFFAFVSRLPIWPFHYWISAVNSGQKNPLVFVVGSLMPLVGLYGFIRFWPNTVPVSIAVYAPLCEVICIITMLFISLVSLSHKELRYKLFAYTTVYCLLYLTGVFLPTGILKRNIGYSLFSYIIIVTVLSFLISHIEIQKKKFNLYGSCGVLCYMPRASKCLSLFILAGIGLPVSSLFWNNFIIVSEIFNYSLILGTLVMLSLVLVALSLLDELYKLKDKTYATAAYVPTADLADTDFAVYILALLILFFTFFKPLWFIF